MIFVTENLWILSVFLHQVYSGQTLRELYPTPTDWPGADDTFIEKRIGYLPKWIKGISSQALDDFKCVLFDFQQNGIVLGVTGDIVSGFKFHANGTCSIDINHVCYKSFFLHFSGSSSFIMVHTQTPIKWDWMI